MVDPRWVRRMWDLFCEAGDVADVQGQRFAEPANKKLSMPEVHTMSTAVAGRASRMGRGGVFYLMWGCFLSYVISVIRRISVDDIIVILIFRLVFISKLSTRIRGQR